MPFRTRRILTSRKRRSNGRRDEGTSLTWRSLGFLLGGLIHDSTGDRHQTPSPARYISGLYYREDINGILEPRPGGTA